MGILFAFMSALAFAVNNVLVKKGAGGGRDQGNEGYFITVVSNIIILSSIFFIVLWLNHFNFYFSWIGTLFFVLSGLLTTGLGRMTNYMAMYRVGPSRASAIKNGAPLFTLLFAFFVLGESIQLGPAFGMIFILSGILLQGIIYFRANHSLNRESSLNQKKTYSYEAIGYFLSVLSCISFGVGYGFRKQAMIFMEDAFYGAMLGAITSLLFLITYELIRKNFIRIVKTTFTTFNPYYIAAGILTSLGPLFFFLALTHTQVSYVSVIAATEPLLTIFLSYLFLRRTEQLSISLWITVSLVFIGILFFAFTT